MHKIMPAVIAIFNVRDPGVANVKVHDGTLFVCMQMLDFGTDMVSQSHACSSRIENGYTKIGCDLTSPIFVIQIEKKEKKKF